MKEAVPVGNGCPVTAPWPCQQYSFCLSFAFVCDGEIDCPDGYDENPRLCVARVDGGRKAFGREIDRFQVLPLGGGRQSQNRECDVVGPRLWPDGHSPIQPPWQPRNTSTKH
ncbi:unnamed protein product [Hydatigera taeniaeformis]|uniref:Low-density lipoprotein receptor domain class A n=1 Tax=Hydatigena taeniaeformis TaxID=6205 RepID=A0A0R3XA01_HYDTA|nr:unnamed protein product [Hydatigera taeniaeformis]